MIASRLYSDTKKRPTSLIRQVQVSTQTSTDSNAKTQECINLSELKLNFFLNGMIQEWIHSSLNELEHSTKTLCQSTQTDSCKTSSSECQVDTIQENMNQLESKIKELQQELIIIRSLNLEFKSNECKSETIPPDTIRKRKQEDIQIGDNLFQRVPCPFCPKTYVDDTRLNRHLKEKHPPPVQSVQPVHSSLKRSSQESKIQQDSQSQEEQIQTKTEPPQLKKRKLKGKKGMEVQLEADTENYTKIANQMKVRG